MNEEASKPPVEKQPPVPRALRVRARKAPSKPRVIDPGIAAIHAEARAKVAEYRKTCSSSRIFQTIIGKRLAQLTQDDKQKLFDALAGTCTPKLI